MVVAPLVLGLLVCAAADVKEAVIGKKDEDNFEDVVSQDEEQTEDEPRDDGEFRE